MSSKLLLSKFRSRLVLPPDTTRRTFLRKVLQVSANSAGVVGIVSMLTSCSSSTTTNRSIIGNIASNIASNEEAKRIAADAFIWGVPLVIMSRTRLRTMFQTVDGRPAVINTLRHQRRLVDWRRRAVVMPNNDTLYSTAWLDLSAGPLVLSVPQLMGKTDRYFSFQLIDWYTNTVGYVGTRSTGKVASSTLIVGPGWQGVAPESMRLLRCPTNQAWLLGRVLADDPADFSGVHQLQNGCQLQPLNIASYVAPLVARPATILNTQTPADGGLYFFDEVERELKMNPAPTADAAIVARMKKIGIGNVSLPSTFLTSHSLDASAIEGLNEANLMLNATAAKNTGKAGWIYEEVGSYGTNYLLRAQTARSGLGALTSEEAKYFMLFTAPSGEPITGRAGYQLTIDFKKLPPIDGFWSLAVYSARDFFPVEAAIDRFSISNRTPGIVMDANGAFTIDIAAEKPPRGIANWLPAPLEECMLVFRVYVASASYVTFARVLPEIQMLTR